METVLTSSCLKTRSSVEEGSGWHWAFCHDPWCLFTCNCQTCCECFCLRELTCMHCVYLALWTCKVLCGSFFLCAICYIYYNNKFSCIHVCHMLPDFQAFKNCIHVVMYTCTIRCWIWELFCVCVSVCLFVDCFYIYISWADSLHLYVILHECIVKYVDWIGDDFHFFVCIFSYFNPCFVLWQLLLRWRWMASWCSPNWRLMVSQSMRM